MILIAFTSSKCCRGVNCACWFPSFRLFNSGLQTAAASHNHPAAVLQRSRPQHRQTQKEEVQVSGGQGAQHPFQVSENAHIISFSDYHFSSVFLLTFLCVTFLHFLIRDCRVSRFVSDKEQSSVLISLLLPYLQKANNSQVRLYFTERI